MAETGSLKIYQNRPGSAQGKCCLGNMENFCLTLFWYSPTYLLNLSRSKITDTAWDIQTATKFVFLNINKVLPNQINSPFTMAL
jgi:hypothetical protein